jgi:predicted TIM-barrel fold metal-dependent hydrolase
MMNPSRYAQEFIENRVLKSLPIIDAHAHMGAVYGTSLSISSADDMVKTMDRENIEMIFCAPHSALFDPASGNSELESAMEKYPDRIKGYFSFNPNYAEDVLPTIRRVLEHPGYIGFKFLPEYHHYSLVDSDYAQVLGFANEHKRALLVHTWGGSAYNSTRQVEQVLKKYPNITVFMGHSAPGECDMAIKLACDYENAYLELCDIHRHNGIIDRMVASAGADKVLFGTDVPWYDPNYCLGSILFSSISDEDRYKIIYGNARRLLTRLTTPA